MDFVPRILRVLGIVAVLFAVLLVVAATTSGKLERGLIVGAVLLLPAIGGPYVLARPRSQEKAPEGAPVGWGNSLPPA